MAFVPHIDVVPRDGPFTRQGLVDELHRLGHAMDLVIRELPGAVNGGPPEFTFNVSWSGRGRVGFRCHGWQREHTIRLNVGIHFQWCSLVETLAHELCHLYRPEGEYHSVGFWSLLNSSLLALYGVPLLSRSAKPNDHGGLDYVAETVLADRYPWAYRVPVQEGIIHELEGADSFGRYVKSTLASRLRTSWSREDLCLLVESNPWGV